LSYPYIDYLKPHLQVFYDIGVVEPLRKVASSPNSVASRLAREALQLIGEEVPHKLTQQVPLWSVEDVSHWVKEVNMNNVFIQLKEHPVGSGPDVMKPHESQRRQALLYPHCHRHHKGVPVD